MTARVDFGTKDRSRSKGFGKSINAMPFANPSNLTMKRNIVLERKGGNGFPPHLQRVSLFDYYDIC